MHLGIYNLCYQLYVYVRTTGHVIWKLAAITASPFFSHCSTVAAQATHSMLPSSFKVGSVCMQPICTKQAGDLSNDSYPCCLARSAIVIRGQYSD
jgi:hypothetical protein